MSLQCRSIFIASTYTRTLVDVMHPPTHNLTLLLKGLGKSVPKWRTKVFICPHNDRHTRTHKRTQTHLSQEAAASSSAEQKTSHGSCVELDGEVIGMGGEASTHSKTRTPTPTHAQTLTIHSVWLLSQH